MEIGEIQLVRPAEDINNETLVGLNGDTEISDRIIRAVDNTGRLFPHVVRHVALNRLRADETAAEADDDDRLREHLRSVRDELKLSLDGFRRARELRLLQARNMTADVSNQRPPYFVR